MSSLLPSAKNVIITGGASGIGLAISRFFVADHDANVFIFDVDLQQGHEATKSLLAQFPASNVQFKLCDISSWEDQDRTFEEVFLEQGNIDIVVANAGISERGSLLNLDGDKPSRPDLSTLSVNLTGTIYTIKLASHYLQKAAANNFLGQGHTGSIICTASVAGIYPFPTAPIYSASKHAIIGLVRSLARPLAMNGISINALAPNVIETNISASSQLFETMHLTPMSTMIRAMHKLVNNRSLTGKVLLISGDEVEFMEPLPESDDDVRHNIEQFWKLGYS